MTPKITQKTASAPQGRPEVSREPFWSNFALEIDFGSHFDDFWVIFEGFSDAFLHPVFS